MTRTQIAQGWQLCELEPKEKVCWEELEAAFENETSAGRVFNLSEFPAQVHDVLLDHGVIENPNIRGQNEDLWMDERDWAYRCSFGAKEAIPSWICLEGADTFADVWLNGVLVGVCSDAFMEYRFPVTEVIGKENVLIVYFHSAKRRVEQLVLPEKYEGRVLQISAARIFRSGFHEYCGPVPSLIRCGLYGRVFCEQAERAGFLEVRIDSVLSQDYGEGKVVIEAEFAGAAQGCRWDALLLDPAGKAAGAASGKVTDKVAGCPAGGEPAGGTGEAADDAAGAATGTAAGTAGCSRGRLELTVDRPVLWWPWTHGNPELYTLVLTCREPGEEEDISGGGKRLDLSGAGEWLLNAGREMGGRFKAPADRMVRRIGFRRIEQRGELCFYINGKHLRLWGVNLAHPDTMTNCYRPERMNRLLDMAQLANCNVIRVWGESEKYPEEFYGECDRRGILIWQDFYLCCSMYPEEEAYLKACREEAAQMVRRLKYHPCILLWCGGNELFLARDYGCPDSYCFGERIVKEVFPKVCKQLDPQRYYHMSSPCGGKWANDPSAGDTHGYTHLWFVPGREYPVFLSENCRVSAPVFRTMERMMTPEELWPAEYTGKVTKRNRLSWPESWNCHTTNEGWKKLGPVEHYPDPENAEELIYRIGAAHGEYIHEQVCRFRRGYGGESSQKRRITNGHMLWKFNNNSNIISFGVVDYFLEPYYPYYELKRCYSPLLVSCELGDHGYVWMTNDTARRVEGTLEVSLFHLEENRVTASFRESFCLEPDESKPLCSLDRFGQFRKENVICAKAFSADGRLLSMCLEPCEIERKLEYPSKTGLFIEQRGGTLVVTSRAYARCVELDGEEDGDHFGWLFEDNYFDLLPGMEKRIRVLGNHQKGTVRAKAWYDDEGVSCEFDLTKKSVQAAEMRGNEEHHGKDLYGKDLYGRNAADPGFL